MEFGLGVQLDDPQLRKMTFAGNIWLSFGNVFQLWQQFLVLEWVNVADFLFFQVHGQDIFVEVLQHPG